MATLQKIQAQIAKLQAQAEAVIAKQSSGVLEKIRDLMEKHGLTTADIDAHAKDGRSGQKRGRASAGSSSGSAKYRNPKTGATWTGHGRAPAWIANAKNRDRFLIDAVPQGTDQVASGAKRAGAYPRGPQPAKYRDPKTGATWSGRGRAPSWLDGVSDRAKYLIEVPAGDTKATSEASSKTTKAPGAAAKKTAAKKTAAKKTAAKKTAAKKTAAKKTAAKNVAAKKLATKGAEARAAEVKKPVASKTAANKIAGSKTATRKVAAKKQNAVAAAGGKNQDSATPIQAPDDVASA
jgi:DNA-binding protein H-NS